MIWCYSEWQSAYEETGAKFVEGLTEEDCALIIIDDLMDEFKKVVDLFTKKAIIVTLASCTKGSENHKPECSLLGSVKKTQRHRSDNLPGEANGQL